MKMNHFTSPHHSDSSQGSDTTVRKIESKSLLGQDGQVVIVHAGQHYLLRQTQAGKLILTK